MTISLPLPSMASLFALVLVAGTSGCVRMYQPMSGLHRPVVVDPRQGNFQDLNLTLNCPAGDYLTRSESANLCQKVALLFENQGAKVHLVEYGGVADDPFGEPTAPGPDPIERPRADLELELRARKVHESNHPVSWALCIVSFTALAGVTETSFAQDVTIRDGSGFLLLTDTLEGRLINRFGAGPWIGNKLLDLTKDKSQRLAGDAADRDLSTDLYRQLSQLMFNAKMQWQVLRESDPVADTVGAP